MSITVYGIPNCDTVRKARNWLDAHEIAYTFHDYKKQGIEPARLQQWIDALGWETLLNTRGTTFRKLPEATRATLGAAGALAIMAEHTSTIKRPVLEFSDGVLAGFREAEWADAIG